MDPHEKLKVGRNIKEEGNDFFKRGQLPDAQKSYTKVLDMLREEISFTGDDQKKERESLILAAHLNLSQCALQFGHYVKAIDHCNTALDLDSNNVKAHFRRAKACENLSEYAKALESYQTVLRLEPNNSAAQKHLSECLKKFARERSMEQMSDTTGVIEVEVVPESCEAEFESSYKKCKKNPGHKEFIDVADFEINHLPPDYRDEDLFACLKHHIQLTVMLEVNGSSEHRPERDPMSGDKYPFSGKRYRKCVHRGTGFVTHIDLNKGDQLCPCKTCQSSESPEKRWAAILVGTVRHVVFDEIEARNTTCYFFYDTGIELKSCPRICGVMKIIGGENDYSLCKLISHDQKLIDILYKEYNLHGCLCFNVDKKYRNGSIVKKGTDLVYKCFQKIQREDELLTKLRDIRDKLMAIYKGDLVTEYQKCLERQRYTGCLGPLGCLLSDKLIGGSEFYYHVSNVSSAYKRCESRVSQSKNLLPRLNAIRQGHMLLTEQIKGDLEAEGMRMDIVIARIENHLINAQPVLADDGIPPAHNLDDYNKDLAIIISHPHGATKKISIGQITAGPFTPPKNV